MFNRYVYAINKPRLLYYINYFINNNFFTNQNIKYKQYSIWDYTYWKPRISFDNWTQKLVIWKYCSIAENVEIMMGWNHRADRISTYPFSVITECPSKKECATSNWDVIVGNDVWICKNVTIMSGVTIGNGAVIALWSVVTKDVEPYSIVGWIPAKIIKYRFAKEKIELLLKNKRWNKDLDKIIASWEEESLMS